MAYLDRNNAQTLLSAANLDALILLSPESFYYATGASPGVATMWREAGAVAVLIPADATQAETAIVSDLFEAQFRANSHISDIRVSPIWVETSTLQESAVASAGDNNVQDLIALAWQQQGRQDGFNRPTTFDPQRCYQHLQSALSDNGLHHARIGYEANAISVRDYNGFRTALGKSELVDATELIARLKMIKSNEEISNLRYAVSTAEIGIQNIRDAISTDVSRDALAAIWQSAIEKAPHSDKLSGSWEYISVGTDPWGGNAQVKPGDLIKVDVGCLVDGYTSDTGRTFVYGEASTVQQQLYSALLEGFQVGSELIRPGVPLSEVHAVTQNAIRQAGFPAYTRGHFGHGLGYSLGSEQWPFISADATGCFEPGMVMAFECPWYINGVGGMIVENQLLVTDTGHEMMNTLPLELVSLTD